MYNFQSLLRLTFLVSFFSVPISHYAQVTRTEGFVDANRGVPNSIIEEIPYVPDTYKGTHYFEDEWRMGNIVLEIGQVIQAVPLKYDLRLDRLEFQYQGETRFLESDKIDRFDWVNPDGSRSIFVHASLYLYHDIPPLQGMVELVVDGEKLKLLSKPGIIVKEGNYNVQIDIGDRTPELVKQEKFYFVLNQNVYAVPPGRRKRSLFFKSGWEEVQDFAKKERLNFKTRDDLRKIVQFYESL